MGGRGQRCLPCFLPAFNSHGPGTPHTPHARHRVPQTCKRKWIAHRASAVGLHIFTPFLLIARLPPSLPASLPLVRTCRTPPHCFCPPCCIVFHAGTRTMTSLPLTSARQQIAQSMRTQSGICVKAKPGESSWYFMQRRRSYTHTTSSDQTRTGREKKENLHRSVSSHHQCFRWPHHAGWTPSKSGIAIGKPRQSILRNRRKEWASLASNM